MNPLIEKHIYIFIKGFLFSNLMFVLGSISGCMTLLSVGMSDHKRLYDSYDFRNVENAYINKDNLLSLCFTGIIDGETKSELMSSDVTLHEKKQKNFIYKEAVSLWARSSSPLRGCPSDFEKANIPVVSLSYCSQKSHNSSSGKGYNLLSGFRCPENNQELARFDSLIEIEPYVVCQIKTNIDARNRTTNAMLDSNRKIYVNSVYKILIVSLYSLDKKPVGYYELGPRTTIKKTNANTINFFHVFGAALV